MKKKVTISLTLGIIISAIALYLAFKNVPFADLLSYLAEVNYLWVIPSVLLALFSFVIRAIRWRIMLETAKKLSFWRAFHPMMIGFMINCVLPGRVGEIARPVILQKKENVPFSTGLATVVAERVFDFSLLVVFFAVVLANIQIDPGFSIRYGSYELNREILITVSSGMLKLCLALIVGIITVSIEKTRKIIKDIIMKIPQLFFWGSLVLKEKIGKKICTPLVGIVENFATGFSLMKDPKKIGVCSVLSIFIWLLAGASYYILAMGCPGIDLSFFEISAVMIIVCFFIALPSVPGFWGLWEAGGVFALSIFGVSSKDAAGFTLVNHAIQMFPVIMIGFASAVITGINIWRVSFDAEASEN